VEFKLNKIDTDIRVKMQEEIKDDKIHSGKNINVKKDIKDERHKEIRVFNGKECKKRYITIDGVKYYPKNMKIDVAKTEEINAENSKGRILDTKK